MGFLEALGVHLGAEGTTCTLCGDPLGLRVRVDSEGKRFCLHHGLEPLCRDCGRLGGRLTSDGAWLCQACEACGVRGEGHARAILEQVRRDLQALGFHFPAAPLPVRLVHARELNSGSDTRVQRICEGQIHSRHWENGTFEVLGISIQRGLPPVSCGRVLAHELGHVWLLRAGFAALPPLKSEGLCELCAWLWMTCRKRPAAAFKIRGMEDNPDPVYGAGFRAALNIYRVGGLASLGPWLRDRPS